MSSFFFFVENGCCESNRAFIKTIGKLCFYHFIYIFLINKCFISKKHEPLSLRNGSHFADLWTVRIACTNMKYVLDGGCFMKSILSSLIFNLSRFFSSSSLSLTFEILAPFSQNTIRKCLENIRTPTVPLRASCWSLAVNIVSLI